MCLQAARREMERQRQMEWERQRKEQLMAEKAREYEQLSALKSRSSNLKCELESLVGDRVKHEHWVLLHDMLMLVIKSFKYADEPFSPIV